MKIVINACYGGFHPSIKALREYLKRKGKESFIYSSDIRDRHAIFVKEENEISSENWMGWHILLKDFGDVFRTDKLKNADEFNQNYFSIYNVPRHDPDFVAVVEELGEEANTPVSELKVVEIPDGIEYIIEEYDGSEWIAEKHRTWN